MASPFSGIGFLRCLELISLFISTLTHRQRTEVVYSRFSQRRLSEKAQGKLSSFLSGNPPPLWKKMTVYATDKSLKLNFLSHKKFFLKQSSLIKLAYIINLIEGSINKFNRLTNYLVLAKNLPYKLFFDFFFYY